LFFYNYCENIRRSNAIFIDNNSQFFDVLNNGVRTQMHAGKKTRYKSINFKNNAYDSILNLMPSFLFSVFCYAPHFDYKKLYKNSVNVHQSLRRYHK